VIANNKHNDRYKEALVDNVLYINLVMMNSFYRSIITEYIILIDVLKSLL